ncbi:MAG: dUTP diphosphatase [Candidatus Woesearchaeota archaeon]
MVKKIRGFEKISTETDNEQVKLPVRSTAGSAAYDLYSPVELTVPAGYTAKIKTGVKVYMQSDEGFFIITRSGNGTKRRVTLSNNVGLVDSDYYNNEDNEGEIIVFLANDGEDDFEIKQGDRIAQGYFQKILLADDDKTIMDSRTGGFGSTGSR